MPSNYRVILKSRPGPDHEPQEENFEYGECEYPAASLQPGEVVIKTCYLSVDPAQRCQMNEDPGVHYIQSWQIGGTILGLNGLGIVVESSNPNYSNGDLVQGSLCWPWQLYFIENLEAKKNLFSKVHRSIVGDKPSLILSLFGIAGLTAFLGVRLKGNVKPGTNQTIVVSGAAGACGSLAGQVARLDGCSNIVGICGSQAKCDWLTKGLLYNDAINYKTEDIEERLKSTCSKGIDIYFDNVGGEISDSVIKQMNQNGHIVLCGQISVYNKDLPYPPPIPDNIQQILKEKNITRERYLVLDHQDKFAAALRQLTEWYFMGKIKVKETVEEGLDNAGKAFVSMMRGGNIGKQLVHVSDP